MEKNNASRVSVIVPVFNGRRYLEEALASVQRQTLSPDEIILVDDGSTDGSWELMCSLSGGKIHVAQQVNSGPAAARNLGFEKSTGNLIAFLDCDDLWEPEKLELQVDLSRSHPSAGVFYTAFSEFFSPDISPLVKQQTRLKSGLLSGLVGSTIMVRREVFEKVGVFDSQWRTGELIDWWSRAREKNIEKKEIDRVLVWRRIHDNNLGRSAARDRRDYLGIIKASLDRRK